MFKTIRLFVAMLQLVGCTTMVPVAYERGHFDPAVIRVGDSFAMTTTTHAQKRIEVVVLGIAGLVALAVAGAPVAMP